MGQPGRQYTAGTGYRYGFNGKENDNEIKGEGNQQDYGMRIYDPRLGRFLSVDPISKSFPWYTPYQFSGNKPIWAIDLDGGEEKPYYHVNIYRFSGETVMKPHSVMEFKEGEKKYRVAGYPTQLFDSDGKTDNRYPRSIFFVEDKSLVNESDYNVGDGTVVRTKGTNWHYWMSNNESSEAMKVSSELCDGTGIAVFKSAYFVASLFTGGGANLFMKGVSRFSTDAGGQFMSTGGNVEKFNITALITSPFFGNGLQQISSKNIINSFAEVNSQGYNGVVLSSESIKNKIIQAGVGIVFDKAIANLQIAPDFNKNVYTRLRNLSYKPKFALQFSEFMKKYSQRSVISNIANSGGVGITVTAAGNAVAEAITKEKK